jgi:hypothetical protein
MLAELRERDATGEIATIYDESATLALSGSGRPPRGPHPRDIISHTQTPAAAGSL